MTTYETGIKGKVFAGISRAHRARELCLDFFQQRLDIGFLKTKMIEVRIKTRFETRGEKRQTSSSPKSLRDSTAKAVDLMSPASFAREENKPLSWKRETM